MLDIYSKKFDERKKKLFLFIEAFALTAVYIIAVYFTCGMWFETNDDVFISEILSGKVTGAVDFHNAFSSILITGPLALLYSLTSTVPWWGILIFLCLCVVLFCALFFSLLRTHSFLQNFFAVGIILSVTLIGIHSFGQVQYTSCAMLLATAGYFILLCDDNRKRACILFCVFELFSCALRDKSMMMMQPVCFSVVAIYHLVEVFFKDRKNLKSEIKRMIVCFLMVLAVLGIVQLGKVITFYDADWNEFKKSDTVSTYLLDYEGWIEYSKLENVLAKHNISEADYNQFLEYRIWYPDYKFTSEFYDDILPILKEIRELRPSRSLVITSLTLLYASSQFWHLHQITLIMFFATAIVAFLCGKRRHLITVGFSFLGYLFGIVFLALRDRYALRVMMPYYVGTILMLSGLLLLIVFTGSKEKKQKVLNIIVSGGVLFIYVIFALYVGRVQFAYIRRQNNFVNANELAILKDITNYCNANAEKTFIVDNSYFRSISTPVFESEYYQKANFLYSGSWFETAPTMILHGKEYLNETDFYVLVYEAQEWKGLDAIEYWEQVSGCTASLYDKFKISNGATIWVYNLKR